MRAFLARAAGCDADDLAQEAFVRAWQRAGDYRGQGSYAAWIMGIGWRLFLDQRRTARRREGLAGADDDAPTSTDPRGASDAAIYTDRLLAAHVRVVLGHQLLHLVRQELARDARGVVPPRRLLVRFDGKLGLLRLLGLRVRVGVGIRVTP